MHYFSLKTLLSSRAFNADMMCSSPWTNILKIKQENQNLELIIEMPLGLNASDSENMYVIFSKLLDDGGGRDQDKLWHATEIPEQEGAFYYHVLIIVVKELSWFRLG